MRRVVVTGLGLVQTGDIHVGIDLQKQVAFVDELIHVGRGYPPRYELPKAATAEEVVERAIQSGV